MERRKLVILGGSSPFTLELINSLERTRHLTLYDLFLHGRNRENLFLVGSYAKAKLESLGWKVEFGTSLEQALEGASIIIHQIRYGDLEGRVSDENLAIKFGLPLDETLGPSGLQAAIRLVSQITPVLAMIKKYSPKAFILNLTNPLSVAVSVFHEYGLKQVVGLCELPVVTFQKLAQVLNLSTEQIEWDYLGLNHRGFIYNLRYKGEELLPQFLANYADDFFEEIPIEKIKQLQAIPLKYFKLMLNHIPAPVPRAKLLTGIRNKIAHDLKLKPDRPPTSLKNRSMLWYSQAVIPALLSIELNKTSPNMVVNLTNAEGLTTEVKSIFTDNRFTEISIDKKPTVEVEKYYSIFYQQEKAVLEAALSPDSNKILNALRLDPIVPERKIELICNEILKYYNQITTKSTSL